MPGSAGSRRKVIKPDLNLLSLELDKMDLNKLDDSYECQTAGPTCYTSLPDRVVPKSEPQRQLPSRQTSAGPSSATRAGPPSGSGLLRRLSFVGSMYGLNKVQASPNPTGGPTCGSSTPDMGMHRKFSEASHRLSRPSTGAGRFYSSSSGMDFEDSDDFVFTDLDTGRKYSATSAIGMFDKSTTQSESAAQTGSWLGKVSKMFFKS